MDHQFPLFELPDEIISIVFNQYLPTGDKIATGLWFAVDSDISYNGTEHIWI